MSCFVLAGILSLNSCVKGDIDDLQNQINDLNEQVQELESAQQQALLAAIAKLEADMASLNAELAADLALIEQEVENNANAVYYGNVITEADYAALAAQGATIITGKVVVAGDAHVTALKDVKLIGKNLEIAGGTAITMDALQSVGEDLLISGVSGANASVNLAVLTSVGGDVEIMNNSGLTSFMADELVLVSGALMTEMNTELAALSVAKLDQVGEVMIDGYWEENPDYSGVGKLATLELSGANVEGDFYVNYISEVENLTVGNVGGNLNCLNSKIAKITIGATSIDGDLVLENNSLLSSIDVLNLTRIEGKLSLGSNTDYNGGGLVAMPAFNALTYIGGNVSISNNTSLKTCEAFNNVTEVRGTNIDFSSNGNLDNVSIFNALVDTANPASQWGDFSHASINIFANTFWFNGFESLKEVLNVNINVAKTAGQFNEETGEFEPGGDTSKLEGFDMLTDLSTLTLNIGEITSFDAFGALNNFKNYQTYLTVYMPTDTTVGMCSMAPIFAKIKNGDFDNWNNTRLAVFKYNWADQDRDTAIDQLLAPCGV